MFQLSPNIELIFTEAGDYPDRVRAAAAAGFDAVEMWGPTGNDGLTGAKDIPALKAALDETGVQLTAQLIEPRTQFLIPPKDHSLFFHGLDTGVAIARELGCPNIIVNSGTGFGGSTRATQLDELVDIFSKATAQIQGSGITLIIEAVNIRVDHPGQLLDRTSDAAYIARGVDSPFFGVLYDLYHSVIEEEDVATELSNARDVIRYVEISDVPGRGEPGTGDIDWSSTLCAIRDSGYSGPIGLEYRPVASSTESAKFIQQLARA